MDHFETNLEKYAELVVKVALNIQEGQKLYINASIENADFVQSITRKAYRAGAKKVYPNLYDPMIRRITYEEAPKDGLAEFPQWRIDCFNELIDEGGAFLEVAALDPELLKGVDADRISIARKAEAKAKTRFQKAQTNGDISWSIVSVPSKNWAAKIFPDVPTKQQTDALWEQIFYTTRVDQDDPVAAWEKHIDKLTEKANYLNEKRFKALHYKAEGTNLTIQLADDHVWRAASFETKKGNRFLPNVPTEEVFTMPHKDGVNGTVSSTKPLNYQGSLIENFTLTFKNGEVVDFKAEKGEESLKNILEADEGSKRLGEVALVPHDSPISNSGLIFFNTLFDENASCHIALGRALLLNMKDAEAKSDEEMAAKGFNSSIMHVDFMIGSAELDIDGETFDGERVPVFRKGNWAF
ncbi:MAG TPA: aminopeptidase [Bacillales bacterium]|nr:aminopeptidase [Bacillales bacterium]